MRNIRKASGTVSAAVQPFGVFGVSADALVTAIRRAESQKIGAYRGSKGIHTRISGINDALRARFGVSDVAAFWQAAVAAKIVDQHPCKGGYMVYVAGEMPAGIRQTSDRFGLFA